MEKNLDFLTKEENEVRNKFLEKFNIEELNKINDNELLPYKIYGNKEHDSMAYNLEFVLNNDFGSMRGRFENIKYPIYLTKENNTNTWKKNGNVIQIEEITKISVETRDSINSIDKLIKSNKMDDLFVFLNNKKHIFKFRLMHKYLCVAYPKLFLHWHIKEKFTEYMKILNLNDDNNIFVVEKYFWDKYKNNIEKLNMKQENDNLEKQIKENRVEVENNQNKQEAKDKNNVNENKNNQKNKDVEQPLNQILYGPPGTGKTYNTVIKAMEIIDNTEYKNIDEKKYKELQDRFNKLKQEKQIEFITFHQSYSYEEFIEGIKPVINNASKEIKYEIKKGIFKDIRIKANSDPKNNYVLIIDEINRGNISKIFGELITLIEEDKRIGNPHELKLTLPYSQEEFGIPKNLYIIGTMNTSDRSIASVDIALRRRFKFIEMMPKSDLVTDIKINDKYNFKNIFEALNEKITVLLDRDHQIGHGYFMKDKINDDIYKLRDVWFDEILPLLNEYFYNDWEKLQALLGEASDKNDSFIVTNKTNLPFYNYDIEDKIYNFAKKEDMKEEEDFKLALSKIIEATKKKENNNEIIETK